MIIAVTITGKDRPGIIAHLAKALYQSGGNLEDASMTILEGEFAMIFLAAVQNQVQQRKFLSQLGRMEKLFGLSISIKEIKHSLKRGQKHGAGTVPWIISVSGKDRAGIVYLVSKVCADHHLNITDLNSKILGKGKQTAYALILEVDIPKHELKLIAKLKQKFSGLEKKLGVKIAFNPIEDSHF